MIEARGLTKVYGDTRAVDDLSFTVQPGMVTGFLGPNGAGKSTTMRMILGLDAPTQGSVTVNGKAYVQHADPLPQAGARLAARAHACGNRAGARGGGARGRGACRRRQEAGRRLLPGDGAAARPRLGPARRP